MTIDASQLLSLGWSNFFFSQLSLEDLECRRPARVVRVERGRYGVDAGAGEEWATLAGRLLHRLEDEPPPTVGDWVLLEAAQPVIVRCLERRSLIARREAGGSGVQAIASNIDVMLVVSGLDAEFNLHRIERYLVLAAQSEVLPVVVLTKADLCADPAPLVAQVRERLPAGAEVIAVDALHERLADRLAPWLGAGSTLTVVGSSGVGKSTVANNLAGNALQATGATRRDAKGRHTTTARALVRLPGGACIIDVPGMREVGLAGEGGVARQFRSIVEVAAGCRFADCTHQTEPGCAVVRAVEQGEVAEDEWQHYLKLLAEERHQVAEHEKRRRERVFGKVVKTALAIKRRDQRS